MAVLASAVLVSCGITAPRSDAGYANLDSPGMLDTHRTTALSIGPTLLRFAARYLDDDPEVTIINIMGAIDPVHFNDVMLALDIDHVPEARLATVN